jgi:hypothetical protein
MEAQQWDSNNHGWYGSSEAERKLEPRYRKDNYNELQTYTIIDELMYQTSCN